jgi:hypothetical protein
MNRLIPFVLFAAAMPFCCKPTMAQSTQGWKVRVDRSTSASDPDASGAVKFTATGSGYRATNPQAAVYWNPANTASGSYTLKGNFTLLEPSNHTNYYGLVFGGKDLEGAQQTYTYFTVAQDGTWLLKRREGSNTSTVSRGPSSVIKTPGSDGKSVNSLEVRVSAPKVDFVVNGTVVHSEMKGSSLGSTDGIYGARVNHFLNVQIDGLTVSR